MWTIGLIVEIGPIKARRPFVAKALDGQMAISGSRGKIDNIPVRSDRILCG
jgi:hypothetical protein